MTVDVANVSAGDVRDAVARTGMRAELWNEPASHGGAAPVKAMPHSADSAWLPLFGAWLVSVVATMGSLFFSEVMGLPPCVLCWYQRVCMYPLVVIFTVALLTHDTRAPRYAWPLILAGLGVASYHNLLYYHFLPESITPCAAGVSCTERQIEWLGFVSIPLLSFSAFLIIVALMLWSRVRLKRSVHENQ